ncbi:MAG: hypothetical protein ABI572_10990 [Actinomycetota bacterium]
MTDYVLVYEGGSMPEGEEAQKQVMAAWDAWFASVGDALKDGGNPFTGQSRTIATDGAVSDGGGGSASGYTILKADSLDDAVSLSKGCPVLAGGSSITIHETFAVM